MAAVGGLRNGSLHSFMGEMPLSQSVAAGETCRPYG